MEQYQDIIKNGTVIRGVRECEARYAVIKEILKQFHRPFSVLDLGANLGYFSFRISEDFPKSTIVMIEDLYSDQLLELCLENNKKNIIFLKKNLNVNLLKKLGECEHFDVVLALNVIHHIGEVSKTLKNIENLGEHIIIETPHFFDDGSCGKDNLKEIYNAVEIHYKKLGNFSRHTSNLQSIMGVNFLTKNFLETRYWDYPKDEIQTFKILSSEKTKIFVHPEKKEERAWIEGINFRTFQYMNGIYPTKETILKSLRSLEISDHNDLTPWNLIITGELIIPIDNNDPRHLTHTNTEIQLKKLFQEIESKNMFPVNYYKPEK